MKSLLLRDLSLLFPISLTIAVACGGGGTATPGGAVGGAGGTGSASGGALGSGGALNAGGNLNSGGALNTGGASVVGGGTSAGGNVGPSGGGTAPNGGSDPGSGGASAGGGSQADGGATASGGAPAGGGASGSDVVRSMGCDKSATLTSGSRSLQVSGENRSFMLRIPDNYDSAHPYRLVFAFHWNGGTMNDVDGGGSSGFTWSYYGLREQAEDSTIFVAPQGLNNGWANTGGRDLAFVDAMIAQIEGNLCVDKSRVFSMGFSYGGGMTYGLACDRADVFRAVAVYSGAQLSGCSDGSKPVAYLGIHGISDGTCTIAGGRSLRDRFVANNGCTTQSPPEPGGGSATHNCTSYQGCDDDKPVRWCAFDGGHTPGPVEGGGDDGARTWTKTEAWEFFSQF